jgi:drug/metabolite transporter (DMT)-like permease
VALILLLSFHRREPPADVRGVGSRFGRADVLAALLLALYAIPFAWAYGRLATGTGALILFAAVQSTLVVAGVVLGERPHATTLAGMAIAFAGLGILVAPRVEAPSVSGTLAMVTAGAAWGLYTLRGRACGDPLAMNARAFILAAPIAIAIAALWWTRLHATPLGVVLAVASGAIASGLGYVVWYRALNGGLSATAAAAAQLAVPLIAATGGIVLLGESFHPRVAVAALAILAGLALAMPRATARRYVVDSRATCASQIARTRSNVSASAGVLSSR